ncbi:uncharacterized protein LOC117110724 [Anneissia japonica]|uniref:uncharacterized protein LOC117110724 n=1 Tax=Anneissia japonica TaxID=1529436 RepID=UPI0014256014|nr:uncharacterized protein LOC117110724 [Anneissia japonica]
MPSNAVLHGLPIVVCVIGIFLLIVSTVSSELCGEYYDLDGNYRPTLNCSDHITGPYCCGEQYNRTCCSNQKQSIYWPRNILQSIEQSSNVSATFVFFLTFIGLVMVFTMSITCCCFYCCQDDLPRYSIQADEVDADSEDNNLEAGGLDWDDSAHNSIKSFVDDDGKDEDNSDSYEDNEYALETDPLKRHNRSEMVDSQSANENKEIQDKC